MAWGRKTGGRKKGTPNKSTSVLAAQAEAVVAVAGGEEPIQYMMRIMNDPRVEQRHGQGCRTLSTSTIAGCRAPAFGRLGPTDRTGDLRNGNASPSRDA
jgi:hypothetical protein